MCVCCVTVARRGIRFRALPVLVLACLGLGITRAGVAAAECAKLPEDVRRETAIAEFTARMKAANHPALFDKAAQEFNVPADILKGVAFAETRWEHLTWPPGENYSPETGMPCPYGIMSLWSNEFFGLSLVEAAKLIQRAPEELKRDPLQNIRGGAALLRKLYDENPKPDGTTAQDIESWRYAIVKYCGVPEPDLSHQHALSVYEYMNQGYHQYSIEWNARPVNLEPMREEVKRITAGERRQQAERTLALEAAAPPPSTGATATGAETGLNRAAAGLADKPVPRTQTEAAMPARPLWWMISGLAALLLLILLITRRSSKPPRS